MVEYAPLRSTFEVPSISAALALDLFPAALARAYVSFLQCKSYSQRLASLLGTMYNLRLSTNRDVINTNRALYCTNPARPCQRRARATKFNGCSTAVQQMLNRC